MSELKTNLEQILQEKTTKLIPENIKRKVEIFDVTGTDGDAEVEELQAKITETRQEIADTRRDLENSAATVTGTEENVTLNQTAEATFKKLGVGGNTKQAQYTGKNLAKVSGSASVNLFGSISVSKDSNDIIINGTATGDIAAQKAFVLDGDIHGNYAAYITPSNTMSLTAGTYVLTVNNITGSYSGVGAFWIRFVKKNESRPHTAIASLTLPSTSVSFNIEVDGEYFISPNFSYTSETNVTFNNYKFNIMLASGSDTSYEPYVGGTASPNPDYPQEITNVTGDVEVVVENKNLALNDNPQNPDANYSSSGGGTSVVQYSTQEGGYYTTNHRRRSFGILKAGSYTLSIKAKTRDGNSGFVILTEIKGYAESIMSKSSLTNNYTKYTYTFTILENKEFAVIFYNSLYWKDIQLEKGTTSTDYVEHKQQTFTFPLGNEKLMLGDYLADGGIHHVKGQVMLNENLFLQYNSKPGQFYVPNQTILQNYKNATQIYSNYFKYSVTSWKENCLGITSNNTFWIYIKDGPTTLTELRSWLSTHNTIVEYELEEEVIVPYTSAQQEVYNQIKQALSYEEQTNVSSSDTISPIFTVTAFRDADLAIASLDNQLTLKE